MSFVFSKRSLKNLVGVHPDLIKVLTATLDVSPVDFGIIQGLRTPEEQHALFLAGKTQLDYNPNGINSRHLTGKAVDFAVWKDGAFSWDEGLCRDVGNAAKICAKHLNIPITYGGDWTHFVDADHIELDRVAYPDEPLIA